MEKHRLGDIVGYSTMELNENGEWVFMRNDDRKGKTYAVVALTLVEVSVPDGED